MIGCWPGIAVTVRMGARLWVASAVIVGLASAVVAGVGTYKASPSSSAWAWGLYVGFLGATFIAVLWYALLTHRMGVVQRQGAEVANHPWLLAISLRPDDVAADDGARFGRHVAFLPITNTGRTPALLRGILVGVRVERESSDCEILGGGDSDQRVLVPGDRVDVKLIDIKWLNAAPNPTVYLEVDINYATLDGGSGHLTSSFRYAERVWKPRPSGYEYTLASGGTFPRIPSNKVL